MSAAGVKSIKDIENATNMTDQLMTLLDEKGKDGRPIKDEGSAGWMDAIKSKAERLESKAKYSQGIAADPGDKLGDAQALINLNTVLSGLQYMQGRFNQKYLAQVQEHLPKDTDTPAFNVSKTAMDQRPTTVDSANRQGR